MRRVSLLVGVRGFIAVTGALLAGCASITQPSNPARYIVTSAPLDTGVVPTALCLALDLSPEPAVWWWHPGRSGCSSRSTGPDLLRGEHVQVGARSERGAREVRFQLQIIDLGSVTGARMADVVLDLEAGFVTALASGARVRTHPRSDLNIPVHQSARVPRLELPLRGSAAGLSRSN